MVTHHLIVMLDRDEEGVLQRKASVEFESPKAACDVAQHVVPFMPAPSFSL
jgi:hypothetical protein